MKKVRFALASLAVLAVAAGSFAFKAHMFLQKKLLVGTTSTLCKIISSVTRTDAGVSKVFYTTITTTTFTNECPAQTYTTTPIDDQR